MGDELRLERELTSKRDQVEHGLAIKIAGAAVVRGDPDDRVDVKSDIANDATSAPRAAASSAYIGIIGRPLGVLLGGAYGTLVGSLFDIDGVETTESVLREISNQVHAPRTAVLAQVTEQSPEVIDTAMAPGRRGHAPAARRCRGGDRSGA